MRAGIAVGSNLGNRLANLKSARERVQSLQKIEPPLLASAIYETEPVDCEPGAAKFLNAVIEVGFAGIASELLGRLRDIEKELGRPSAHPRNTSRTIDLDLLYFGALAIDTPELQLPHPRMHERRFVLEPLAEIRPELFLPTQREPVAALLRRLGGTSGLVRIATEW